jgi:serine/threonine protein kinase
MEPHPSDSNMNRRMDQPIPPSNLPAANETSRPAETQAEPTARMNRSVEEDKTIGTGDPSGSGPNKELSYPRKFGHYEILKELGRGGMATVYLANDTRLERKIALKVPHKSVAADPEYMARFLREARSAANLHHPNICTIFEAGEIAGTPYMTMALIEGKSLTELVAEEFPIPSKRVALIIRKIAQAMEVAHKQGIIHRDLKPSNIMIDTRREPIIMDFGLARREDSQDDSRLTQEGLLIGTPIYMAPEVAKKGAALSGVITDVYSLGVILYELLAGRAPYKGTVQAVLVQVMRGQPKPPSKIRPDIDPSIEAICLKAMAKDPVERYQTMTEFAQALREYLQNPDSVTTSALEIVEEVPTPASKTPTERRRASDSGTATRSGGKIRRAEPARSKSSSNSAGLVASLIAAAVIAVVVLIGAIAAFKKARKPGGAPATEIASPQQPATPPKEQAPPPPPPVESYPLVSTKQPITQGVNEVRLAENFRGFVDLELRQIEASGGWHQFQELVLKIDGEARDNFRTEGSWNKGDERKPLEKVDLRYRIRRDFLGELKEGRVIDVDFFAFVIYPPAGYELIKRKIKIHVVKPESVSERSTPAEPPTTPPAGSAPTNDPT